MSEQSSSAGRPLLPRSDRSVISARAASVMAPPVEPLSSRRVRRVAMIVCGPDDLEDGLSGRAGWAV